MVYAAQNNGICTTMVYADFRLKQWYMQNLHMIDLIMVCSKINGFVTKVAVRVRSYGIGREGIIHPILIKI